MSDTKTTISEVEARELYAAVQGMLKSFANRLANYGQTDFFIEFYSGLAAHWDVEARRFDSIRHIISSETQEIRFYLLGVEARGEGESPILTPKNML